MSPPRFALTPSSHQAPSPPHHPTSHHPSQAPSPPPQHTLHHLSQAPTPTHHSTSHPPSQGPIAYTPSHSAFIVTGPLAYPPSHCLPPNCVPACSGLHTAHSALAHTARAGHGSSCSRFQERSCVSYAWNPVGPRPASIVPFTMVQCPKANATRKCNRIRTSDKNESS